jgi:hypothetical protein
MSHAAGFCSSHTNKFYIFGGTSHKFKTEIKSTGQGSRVEHKNAPMHILNLSTMTWESRDSGMKARDDFAFYFDTLDETLYVFGGFMSGYKANDL